MGAQPSPSPAWDDVGPRKEYRRHVKNSRRRQPLRALDGGAKNTDIPIVAAGGNLPSPCSNDVDYVVCVSSEGATTPLEYGQETEACSGDSVGDEQPPLIAEEAAASVALVWRRGEGEGEGGAVGFNQDRENGGGGAVSIVDEDGVDLGQEPLEIEIEDEDGTTTDHQPAGEARGVDGFGRRGSVGGGGGGGRGDGSRVRGFHDMICVGFAVSLCLNVGSLTARQEGFFTAEVKCLSPGASETVLNDLGVWVGWRRAVANGREEAVFDLEELSMTGATMGILTVVGHATDFVVNAVGLASLLYARRKPIEEVQSRLIKRICLASLAMAGWLMGTTVIGFLLAVKGPIGSAAIAFYSQFDLTCRSSVSVGVDYAYAMTTLTILCQFFVGIVALPKPSRWGPPALFRWRQSSAASERALTPSGETPRCRGRRRSSRPWGWRGGGEGAQPPSGYDLRSDRKEKVRTGGWRGKRVDEGIARGGDVICDPV